MLSISFTLAAVAVGQQYQVNLSGSKPDTRVTVGAYYLK
jgi:hypothetical protein